jgi:hypothetical protein
MILTAPASPLVATGFAIWAMWEPTQPCLNSSSSYSTVSSPGKELGSAPLISRTSIWTLLCLIPNMFASSSLTSRTSSSRNTISWAKTEMAGSTLKFAKAVTDFPKLASLPITFSNHVAEGFYEAASTPGLWHHKLRLLQFCLIVDDFCVEYVSIEHFNFLLDLLKKSMVCSVTWLETNLPALPSNGIILANADT